jgi:hypothetical protein
MSQKRIAERVAAKTIEAAGKDYVWDDMAHEAVRNNAREIRQWLDNIIGDGQQLNRALMADIEKQAPSYGVESTDGMSLGPLKRELAKEISKTWGKDKLLPVLVDMLAEQRYIW